MNLSTLSQVQLSGKNSSGLQALPLWKAVIMFGLPALGFRLAIYQGIPAMVAAGLTRFEAFVVSYTVVSAILFALSFGFVKEEGVPMTWTGLRNRFRLHRLNRRAWLLTIGGFLIAFLAGGIMSGAARLMIAIFPAIAPPEFFPAIMDPRVTISTAVFTNFVGESLAGNWGVFILYAIMLFFNIFGEELWWRGTILPRQEKVHGRFTWIVHGLLWTLFHVPFYPWAVVSLLPVCLIISYISQRTQNNTPAILIHWAYNVLPLVFIFAMVMQLI